MFFIYILAYLDRVNVGFAALQMKQQLAFSDAVYGLGAGIFFIGYFLFEVPSNLILHRVGARVWIARIMVTWGLISSCMMLVSTPAQFYVMRFLLGVAEAGFFPGILLYFTWWFPAAVQARTISLFMTAPAVAALVGGPVSGLLLEMQGIAGLAGWQWLFLLEGIPSVVFGFVVLRSVTDRPQLRAHRKLQRPEPLASADDPIRVRRRTSGCWIPDRHSLCAGLSCNDLVGKPLRPHWRAALARQPGRLAQRRGPDRGCDS
jgi:MFS family permease